MTARDDGVTDGATGEARPFWAGEGAAPSPPLVGAARADVVVIGAGFTGLWTALHLTDRDPDLDVVVLEARTVGFGGSGRNGGFVDPSLTHGLENGLAHLPDENDTLLALGRENLAGLADFVREHAIDCAFERTGLVEVAVAPWQLEALGEAADLHRRHGADVTLVDGAGARAILDSPTYLGALVHREGALVDPGALVRGLARVARERGVRIHEGSPVERLGLEGADVVAVTPGGRVRAARAVVATNAWSHRLLRPTGRRFVPVHDYVLVTAPLTGEQRARIGWQGRQGFADTGNRFHYYRLTRDDRILWGGYDAIYGFGSSIGPHRDHRPATYELLERNFRATFPQLDDVPFTHRWGGPIATTSDFMLHVGAVLDGRVTYALGYTGLGVAASRFAARVLADGIQDPGSSLLRLRLVTRRPFPFPPEPLRSVAVGLTRRALIRADRREGRRGPWLRLLDRFGIGFDS
jgi:glycine/D-amino acid oxidase-like deaminating enzyme